MSGSSATERISRPADLGTGIPLRVGRLPRLFWLILLLCVLTLQLFGLFGLQDHGKVSFFKVYHQDTPWLVLCLIALPLIWVATRKPLPIDISRQLERLGRVSQGRLLLAILLASLLASVIGAQVVYHAFTLSVDETLLRFQAQTFNEGYALAPVAPEWQPFATSLQPMYVKTIGDGQYWYANYGPVAALIVAFFGLFGLAAYTHAFLAAACTLLVARISQTLWPGERNAPLLAALLLVTSAQFLFTSMSLYAMTSHLFLNLLWLYLFLKDRPRYHVAAALTGFFAIGLHQVIVHPFFALPFMIDLLRRKRLWPLAVYGVTYALALACWLNWTAIAVWLQGITATSDVEPVSLASQQSTYIVRAALKLLFHDGRSIFAELFFWASNLVRFVAWQNLAALLLGMAALGCWRNAPRPLRLIGISILTSLIPYLLLMPGQGHGWGYRHIHVHLGSFALLAVFGWHQLRNLMKPEQWRRWRRAIVALAVFSAVVGLPLRAVQVDRFLTPFVDSLAYLSQREEQVVLVDRYRIWYGTDLIRNDPLLRNSPKIMDPYRLGPDDLRTLCARYSVLYVGPDDLERFGMRKNNPEYLKTALEENGDVLEKLAEAQCIAGVTNSK